MKYDYEVGKKVICISDEFVLLQSNNPADVGRIGKPIDKHPQLNEIIVINAIADDDDAVYLNFKEYNELNWARWFHCANFRPIDSYEIISYELNKSTQPELV